MADPALERLLVSQRTEITEYHIYLRLAQTVPNHADRQVLQDIAHDEKRHHDVLCRRTGQTVAPAWWRVWCCYLLARVLGYTFVLRLMERGEDGAQANYRQAACQFPEVERLAQDEEEHEQRLLAMLDEQRLRYAGSMVLGLNDALVELTGAIAGFTLALGDPKLILLAASVTGVSAALSMAASEYLATKHEGQGEKDPLKAALYTGAAYFLAVFILVAPFVVIPIPLLALACTLVAALALILAFTYYLSITKGAPLWKSYVEMAGISMAVAGFSFLVGLGLRWWIGVDI